MKKCTKIRGLPRYRGRKWIEPALPELVEPWLFGKHHSVAKDRSSHATLLEELGKSVSRGTWKWPKQPLCFISDLHADSDAFWASLVASGGVKKRGREDKDFELTKFGRKARILVGGDCFDKGPSSIHLLDNIRLLAKRGADVRILAGNHDVRMMLGIRAVGLERDPRTEHFFIRMGPKVVPFLKEVHERYLRGQQSALRGVPATRECRRQLYPSRRWFDEFPLLASWVMPDQGIEREMKRLKAKMDRFEDDCVAAGLSLRMAYAAARKWQTLFLKPKGEYAWFFKRMKLARREGSFLFIHAGLDDRSARLINEKGVGHLNRLFRTQVEEDLFDFYYGPIANTIRTKYRDTDMPLTHRGVKLMRESGIHAIVHGHINLLNGQRIMLRKGMVHFECDTTMDRCTRAKEGLGGYGAAVTIFHPAGHVLGVSSDYPFVKYFEPGVLRRTMIDPR